jgi:hypothetical protein
LYGKKLLIKFDKNGFAHILGNSFTISSGHPGQNAHLAIRSALRFYKAGIVGIVTPAVLFGRKCVVWFGGSFFNVRSIELTSLLMRIQRTFHNEQKVWPSGEPPNVSVTEILIPWLIVKLPEARLLKFFLDP